MIRFLCPNCQKKLGVGDTMAGRPVVCPQCQHKFRVPQPEVEASEEAAPPPKEAAPAARFELALEPEPELVKKRKPVREDEDSQDRPKPKRKVVLADDGSEDEDRPRPKKKKKGRRSQAAGGLSALEPYLRNLLIVGVIGVISSVLGFISPTLLLVPIGIGWIVSLVGDIWFLIVAFQDSPGQGILCILCWPYQLFYLISNWEETQRPFFVALVGTGILMAAAVVGAIVGAR